MEQLKKYGLEDLTDAQRAEMTEEAIATHERKRKQMDGLNEQIQKQLGAMDPYRKSIEVLDVDYDDFLVMYTCWDTTDDYNAKGQSRQTIDSKKQDMREEARHYDMYGLKWRVHDVLERQQETPGFVQLIEKLQTKKVDELNGEEDYKKEIKRLARASLNDIHDVFFQSIPKPKYWPLIRPLLKYPLEKLEAVDEPIDYENDQYSKMQFDGIFDEDFKP